MALSGAVRCRQGVSRETEFRENGGFESIDTRARHCRYGDRRDDSRRLFTGCAVGQVNFIENPDGRYDSVNALLPYICLCVVDNLNDEISERQLLLGAMNAFLFNNVGGIPDPCCVRKLKSDVAETDRLLDDVTGGTGQVGDNGDRVSR